MSKDHIDRVAGEPWFIFGERPGGLVDLSDGTNDVFERLPRDVAERIVKPGMRPRAGGGLTKCDHEW